MLYVDLFIYLFRKHIDFLAPLLTKVVNESFTKGCFSEQRIISIALPILKKENLDNEPKNYRPVNTLPAVLKLVERAMNSYLECNSLVPSYINASEQTTQLI